MPAGTTLARRDSSAASSAWNSIRWRPDRPGELPAGHRRSAARRRRGRNPRLALRRDPGRPGVGRPAAAALRFRGGQSALDRLGQPARALSPGDQAALGAVRPVFAFGQRGPAWRRQERPRHADALPRRRSLSEAGRPAGHGHHANAVSDQGGRRRLPPLPPRARGRVAAGGSRRRPGGLEAVSRRGQPDQHDRADQGRENASIRCPMCNGRPARTAACEQSRCLAGPIDAAAARLAVVGCVQRTCPSGSGVVRGAVGLRRPPRRQQRRRQRRLLAAADRPLDRTTATSWCKTSSAKAKRSVPAVRAGDRAGPALSAGALGRRRRWSARPSAHILLAQDVTRAAASPRPLMRREYPRTYAT